MTALRTEPPTPPGRDPDPVPPGRPGGDPEPTRRPEDVPPDPERKKPHGTEPKRD